MNVLVVQRVPAIVRPTAVLPVFDSVGDAIAGTPAVPGERVAQPVGKGLILVAAARDGRPGRSRARLPG